MKIIFVVFLNLLLISNVFAQTKTEITAQCTEGNCIDGKGKKVWSNGKVYIGDFKNGLRDGSGINELNGYKYNGEWKEDLLHGQGKFIFKSGDVYEGELKDGKYNGQGKYISKDKEVYEGAWKDGEKHGLGKSIYRNGDVYVGEYKDHIRHGQGKYIWKDGDVYEGEWKDDGINGQGKFIFKSGNVYEGAWKDGEQHGLGKYIYRNGKTHYEGQWKNGKKHGQGKIIWPPEQAYQGEFFHGSRVAVTVGDPKKYWEGAINCYRFTKNPNKENLRPYIDQLTLRVESYKRYANNDDETWIIQLSETIVERLGCPKDLFN